MDIRFRIWSTEDKAMVYWNRLMHITVRWFLHRPSGFKIMQTTGLNDEYGERIYDGDVLYDDVDIFYAEVVYQEGAYMVIGNGVVNYLGEEHKNMYIVGNIYEDADKLKDWGLRE